MGKKPNRCGKSDLAGVMWQVGRNMGWLRGAWKVGVGLGEVRRRKSARVEGAWKVSWFGQD
jgi:hypothetical protein